MEDDQDFEYQLQQEALEAAAKQQQQVINNDATAGNTNPYTYRDPDGIDYEWDPVKKAWFPRINDDFIARYQASYGNYEETSNTANTSNTSNGNGINENENTTSKSVDETKSFGKTQDSSNVEFATTNTTAVPGSRKRAQPDKEPEWFQVDDEHNTNVYVSNLPMDITEEEFAELMKKCGLIMKDERNQLKIKLYRDEMGMPKGDGRCCYIKRESVDLALNILDGYLYRDKNIKVERAQFSLKGAYDPSKKPKKKKSNKRDKEKQKKRMEKLFDWRPDKLAGERAKHEKVVIISNMFDPKMFEADPKLILEYRSDLREECEEKCGPVRKVDIYDLHPDGVAAVTFNEFEDADKCIELMNGRFFAGRRLEAKHWDGKTKYKVQETEEEIEKRMAKWDQYLEQQNEATTTTTSNAES